MLILNKLVPIFVLPLGLALILLVYALASKKRWPIVVAITMLYVAAMPVTGSRLVHWLETRYAMLAPSDLNESDAVAPHVASQIPPDGRDFNPPKWPQPFASLGGISRRDTGSYNFEPNREVGKSRWGIAGSTYEPGREELGNLAGILCIL